MKMREIEGDECGENSEANSAEGQHGAVGSDAPEDVLERKMPRRRDRNTWHAECDGDGSQRHRKNNQARGGESPMLLQQNAEGSADGEGGKRGDSVPGDDLGDMLRADAADAPHGGSRADHAFAGTEEQASEEQKREAEGRGEMEEGGGKRKQAAGGADEQAEHHDALGAEDVHHAADAGAGENRGDVLGADDESREESAVTEPQVNVHREDREQNADGEVANEGEGNGGENFGDGATGKFAGARWGSGFQERIGGGRGGGGVGHRESRILSIKCDETRG